MTVIEIPDDQAAALKAKAAAQGLSLEAWFRKLAEEGIPPSGEASEIRLRAAGRIRPRSIRRGD